MAPLPFAFVVSEKRFWLFLLTALLAAALGFLRVIPDHAALMFVANAGFWFVLATFGIFVAALWFTYREALLAWRWRSLDWASVAVIALGGTVLIVHETFGFKILMDEIMLLGTSMSMHFNKTVLTPYRAADVQGTFVLLEGVLDKRPLFFPFLTSLLHDLTGYRPTNPFILNGVLSFVFLALVNAIGRLLAGRLAGWLGVALFAGFPLLAHNATGGGFELLNLVMILGTLLLGVRFLQKTDDASMTAFCYSALLLAQVRYESVIYLVPVALIVLWAWFRDRKVVLPWPVLIVPLLMVHYPMQNRIFSVRASSWELGSQPGFTTPFSLSYIPDNLAHAASFFFARPSDQPNSFVLSALGCLAVPFFLLLIVKRVRAFANETPAAVVTSLFALGFVAQFALMMCYFWGRFDDPVIRRLSLPTHLGMVIAILAVLPQFTSQVVTRALLGIAVVGLIAVGVPSMAAHAYSQEYLPGKEVTWRRQFIAEQPRKDYMVIDNDSHLWITHRVSSTPIPQAVKRRDSLVFLMRNRAYSDIYVFQRFNIDGATGRLTLRDGDDLGPSFVLETVREERLQTLTLDRLSRVKEIREGPVVLSTPDPATAIVPQDPAAIERARRAYLENFFKQLP